MLERYKDQLNKSLGAITTKITQLFKKKSEFDAVGIAILPDSFDFVLLKKQDDKFAVADVQKVIYEGDEWGQVLKDSIENLKLENTPASIILPATFYQLHPVDRPQVPDEELGMALKWSVKDIIPDIESSVIDHYDVPVQGHGGNKVNLVSVKRDIIERLVESAKKLQLNSIGIEELSYASLLPNSSNANLVITQHPGAELVIHIFKDDALFFSRRLRGYENLVTITDDAMIQAIADNLSLEIQRSLDFFESQLRQAPVQQILIALPLEYNEKLSSAIDPIFQATVKPFTDYAEILETEGLPDFSYFSALGAATDLLERAEA